MKVTKGTFIENIEKHEVRHKSPGVGKYNLIEEYKKPKPSKLKPEEKISHLDDICVLANVTPGTGFYNPHVTCKITLGICRKAYYE